MNYDCVCRTAPATPGPLIIDVTTCLLQVRRLEKELTWSCDQTRCRSKGEEGHFPDRARYRCVHYGNGGKCNKDLCGPCVEVEEGASPKEPSVRKSGREARPSALRAGEEWEVGLLLLQCSCSCSSRSPRCLQISLGRSF